MKKWFWNLILLSNQGLTTKIPKFQVLHEGDKAKLEKSREHKTFSPNAKKAPHVDYIPKINWNFGIFLYLFIYNYYYYY